MPEGLVSIEDHILDLRLLSAKVFLSSAAYVPQLSPEMEKSTEDTFQHFIHQSSAMVYPVPSHYCLHFHLRFKFHLKTQRLLLLLHWS